MLAWIFLLVLADLAYGEKELLLEKPNPITKQWHWKVLRKGAGSGFTYPSNDKPYYAVCDVLTQQEPENWLVVDFVEAKDAKRVFIQLFYTMRSCPAKKSKYCKTEFYLYAHHSKKRDDLIDPTKTSFTRLSTISPTSLIDNKKYNFTYSVAVEHKGVYFAFLDKGSCFVIHGVVISYNFCAAKEQGKFVIFPGTAAPFNDSQPAYAEGTCLDKNSVNTTRLIAMCISNGQWKTSGNVDCLCRPGYGFAVDAKGKNKCEACSSNTYKSVTANSACQPCPLNSSPSSDKTSCFCNDGFYKLPQDAIKPCESGFVSGEDRTVYYNATGIIVNHNYTKDFLEDGCSRSCQDLSADLSTGVYKMLDFFNKFHVYQSSNNTNRSIEGIFFRSPSFDIDRYHSSLKESGVFSILVLRLDFEVENSTKEWSELKLKIINSVSQYLRMVAHFQLHRNVLINETSFKFMEIPKNQVEEYLTVLKHTWRPTTKISTTDKPTMEISTTEIYTTAAVANSAAPFTRSHNHFLNIISYAGHNLPITGFAAVLVAIAFIR